MRVEFSSNMFPGCYTREQKKDIQKILCKDIKARCSLVLKDLMKTHAGNMVFLKVHMPKVLEATLLCYSGDCSKCPRYSVVCSGGVTNSSWRRFIFLGSRCVSVLNMNDQDKFIMLEILKMRLSVAAVEQVRFYTETQKCEAVNRSFSVSLPKNVNYSRNLVGRASSVIHRINNG